MPRFMIEKIVLGGVGVGIAPDVLARAVVHGIGLLELAAECLRGRVFVRHNVAPGSCAFMMGFRFSALTIGTWSERTEPPHSMSVNTASLPTPPAPRCLRRLRCLFFYKPPAQLSSISTVLPSPPIIAAFPARIASRMRCAMNHADL